LQKGQNITETEEQEGEEKKEKKQSRAKDALTRMFNLDANDEAKQQYMKTMSKNTKTGKWGNHDEDTTTTRVAHDTDDDEYQDLDGTRKDTEAQQEESAEIVEETEIDTSKTAVPKSMEDLDKIRETSRLFLRNLPFSIEEADLAAILDPFGANTIICTTKGFAHATFEVAEEACQAYLALDGSSLQGRLLHILPGKAAIAEKPEQERIKTSQKGGGWGGLFMNVSTQKCSFACRY